MNMYYFAIRKLKAINASDLKKKMLIHILGPGPLLRRATPSLFSKSLSVVPFISQPGVSAQMTGLWIRSPSARASLSPGPNAWLGEAHRGAS